jgi:hypothetical protein
VGGKGGGWGQGGEMTQALYAHMNNKRKKMNQFRCMEAMLGISLYSYLYLKLAKMLCLSYLLCFLFNKFGEDGQTGSAWK